MTRTAASLPAPARFRQHTGLLLLAAGTVLVVGMNLLFPSVSQTGLPQGAERVAILGLILYGVWFGLTRGGVVAGRKLAVWLTIGVPLLVWLSVVWWLAVAGGFQTRVGPLPAIVLPLSIGLPILLRSRTIGLILDGTPPAWLVGLQVARILGSAFLFGWLGGNLPGTFALPAGAGDTLVGLLTLPVALVLQSGARGGRLLAIGWNVLGILDLVNAVTLATLTNSVPAYPLVLIPAFGVPMALLLHAVSLRQLRRLSLRKVSSLPVAAASARSA
jgi:hypothetical protein